MHVAIITVQIRVMDVLKIEPTKFVISSRSDMSSPMELCFGRVVGLIEFGRTVIIAVRVAVNENMNNRPKSKKTIVYSTTILSISFLIIGIENGFAYTEPDKTNYVSVWEIIDKKIRENLKQIAEEQQKLEKSENTLSFADIFAIKQRINEKQQMNENLQLKADDIEQLNIRSYVLDKETQKIFDDAEKLLIDKYIDDDSEYYIGENGVVGITVNTKLRQITILVDVERQLLGDTTTNTISSFVDEIKASVTDVTVIVEFGKITDVSCTTRTSTCNTSKGGVQIERQNSGGGGSTLSFSATHSTHGDGFVIAKHEAVAVDNTIVQPANGSSFGTVKTLGAFNCDCAFVKLNNDASVDDSIWAPEAGSTYPINNRVDQNAHIPGTILVMSGVGSGVLIGDIIDSGSTWGKIGFAASGGDSGAPLFKPLANGKADVYGMVTKVSGSVTLYEPWHTIDDQLSLTD